MASADQISFRNLGCQSWSSAATKGRGDTDPLVGLLLGMTALRPVRDLPGHRQPRFPQSGVLGKTAGTPSRASVPRPNVPRKRAAKRPRPVSSKSSVTFGKVSKGRAAALPLVVSRRVWEGNRNPSQNFSSGVWGCILSIWKEYIPRCRQASLAPPGPRPAPAADPQAADLRRHLRRGAPRVWLPPPKFRNGIWGVSHGHPALRDVLQGAAFIHCKETPPKWVVFLSGAGYEARTRYLHLGKVALYQMS